MGQKIKAGVDIGKGKGMVRPTIRTKAYWADYMREYAKKHPEKINEAKIKYRENNRQTLAMKDRLRRYGLTPEQFDQLLIDQQYKCAICYKKIVPYSKIKNESVHVDHSEEYGVRGLLCHNCNIGIGNLQHDPFIIRSSLRYMHRFV